MCLKNYLRTSGSHTAHIPVPMRLTDVSRKIIVRAHTFYLTQLGVLAYIAHMAHTQGRKHPTPKNKKARVSGWKTQDLTIDQVVLLRKVQRDERLSIARLAALIGVPRNTLGRALLGEKVWSVDHGRIVEWIARREAPLPPPGDL